MGPDDDAVKAISSLFRAALDSTADGLLIVDLQGRVLGFNRVFLELWRIPEPLAASNDDAALLGYAVGQLTDPDGFLTRVQAIYSDFAAITFDVVEFKDGRFFERFSRPQLIDGVPMGRVWSFRDVTERRRAERALVQNEAWLRQILDLVPEAIYAKDAAGHFVMANRSAARLFGLPLEALAGVREIDLPGLRDREASCREDEQVITSGQPIALPEQERSGADGAEIWSETRKLPIALQNGEPGVLVVVTDTTARHQLETELRHSQKMEAVGRLAGGIAHDFNNLLTAIIGFTSNALSSLPAADPRRSDLVESVNAAKRAADLTRQLLAFSRRQVLRPRLLDLNRVVGDVERLLRRIVGEDVGFSLDLAPTGPTVRADQGQLEQILVNLAVNACEAMPRGGRLTVETRVEEQQGVAWAVLRISDTGVGIEPAKIGRIFEPFYTTKEAGTGLGLSVVYGIVQQSGGRIAVESVPGAGTRMDVFLPIAAGELAAVPDAPAELPPALPAVILVAEDEPPVRLLAVRVLGSAGYHVLEAADGVEAIAAAKAFPGRIDLLLTDLMMPNLNGRELAAALEATRPGLRSVFMSGYAADSLDRSVAPPPTAPFLAKPFDVKQLLSVVQSQLAVSSTA